MFELLRGFGLLVLYFLVCAGGALALRRLSRIRDEIFRKLLHTILLGSTLVLLLAFNTWWMAALAALGFIALAYPVLTLGENWPLFGRLLHQRKPGELKRSLVAAFGMFAVLLTFCWGIVGYKFLVLACVAAWGPGDAAAALVGTYHGKRFLVSERIEGRKSVEGTLAMFFVSFTCVLIVLLLFTSMDWYKYLVISVLVAAASAAVELYTKKGMDTFTCPLTAAATLIPLLYLGGALV